MTPHAKRSSSTTGDARSGPSLSSPSVFTSFRSSIADWNDVPTGSMNPTILEGDRIFVNKLAYDLKVPFTTWHLEHWSARSRGDIAVFYSPQDGIQLVKRVVGLPGDRVVYHNGKLSINGQELTRTPYTPTDFRTFPPTKTQLRFLHGTTRRHQACHRHAQRRLPGKARHRAPQLPMRDFDKAVPAGHYFMMGDNRDNSSDSRYIGAVRARIHPAAPTASSSPSITTITTSPAKTATSTACTDLPPLANPLPRTTIPAACRDFVYLPTAYCLLPTDPMKKLLVANRSEIAIRVFRAATELGLRHRRGLHLRRPLLAAPLQGGRSRT